MNVVQKKSAAFFWTTLHTFKCKEHALSLSRYDADHNNNPGGVANVQNWSGRGGYG